MRRRTTLPAVAGAAALLLIAGCAQADRSEIATFTDQHGRACTTVVVIDQQDGDREATSIDCEYPPAGRSAGPATQQPLPGQPKK